ncbi:MAG TPA: FAD-dependent oxidoreductase [Dehalococcoidales bacterium]|nr:FAD-dependent oxidoreductase [Dehalococcoidales bacterium]
MNKKIVIIGGTACGPKAAARARRCDQQAQITIVEQETELSVATCGLPYYVSGVIESRLELVQRGPDFFKEVMDIDVLTRTRAIAINRKAQRVEILNLAKNRTSTIEYDKLVLATGSTPVVPDWKGKELKGVFTLSRIEEAQAMRNLVSPRKINKAVIIGAGLIGLEMAEALVSQGVEVSVVEALDWVLPTLLDFEVAAYLEKHLREKGVKLLLGQGVTGFGGDEKGWVNKVIAGDTELETDLALLAIGVKPNTALAEDAGLSIGTDGGIAVNAHLQTSDPDIYAGGDCVENVNMITGQKILAPLGSTANKHGRVIGTNVTGGDETFPGVLGTSIAKVFDYNVGRVGLSQSQAEKAGYEVITSLVPGYEHATYYPNGKEITVKLVAEKANGRLLGGQVVGPGDTAKRIDVLATALTFGATVDDLANTDLAYAPPYNSALDPLHNAANVIRNKQEGYARALTPMEAMAKIKNNDAFIFLDVRSPAEWEAYRIEAPQNKFLPLRELRTKLDELPKDAEIVIVCHTSVRAYQAQRILDGAGFKDVKFLDGSIAAWPYELSFQRPAPAGN